MTIETLRERWQNLRMLRWIFVAAFILAGVFNAYIRSKDPMELLFLYDRVGLQFLAASPLAFIVGWIIAGIFERRARLRLEEAAKRGT